MNAIMETAKPYLYHYGYWAVFFGVFFESLGLPLPGETLIILSGLAVAKGVFHFSWVLVLAVLATFIANNISYAGGYFGGHRFIARYGKYVFINEKRLLALEDFMKRHGSKVVVVGRFILGMRQFGGFIAGASKMPPLKFALYNMIGAVLWVGSWESISYYCGKTLTDQFIQYYFLFGLVLLVVIIIAVCRFFKNAPEIAPNNQPA